MNQPDLNSVNPEVAIATVRDHLKKDERHCFVEREEFCNLLVCKMNLQRFDMAHGKLRGLLDQSTGSRYLIEEEKLFEPA